MNDIIQAWLNYCNIGGWITLLEKSGKYTPREIETLEAIDDLFWLITKEMKEKYQNNKPKLQNKIQEFIKEIESTEGSQWIKERKLEYLIGEKSKIDNKIIEIEKEYHEGIQRDNTYADRELILELSNYKRLIKKNEGLDKRIYWLKYKSEIDKNKITPEDIDRAEQYPIQNLIEVNSAGFAKCVNPSHQDEHPSMFCKNNFAYCFSCNWAGNVIKIAQIIWGTDFVETIKRLNQ